MVGSRCTLILFERVIVATNDLTHAPPKKTKKGAACCSSLQPFIFFTATHTSSRGHGTWGKLGHGDEEDRLLPTEVQGELRGKRVVALAAGGGHTAAVTESGEVYVW